MVAAARRQTHDCGHAASALGRHRPDRCRAPRSHRWPAAPSRPWATPGNLQQTFAARAYIRHGDVALARRDGAQDIDARYGGSVLVPSPANEGEDASRLKGNDAPLAVDDVLIDASTEADSVLDMLPDPQELDMREFAHATPRGLGGNSRESRSRSISATVVPRRKAATLIRPRRSGVTSIVSRAVK